MSEDARQEKIQADAKYPRSRFGLVDAIAILFILAFGGMHIGFYQHSGRYFYDDVFVADCGQSLLHHGYYGIAGRMETNQPPGTAAILAAACALGKCDRGSYLQVMALFETLGFLACYGFLRRHIPRLGAASICLLLISSPTYFSQATQWITPCFPYFFVTIAALWIAEKFEEATTSRSRLAWGTLLAILAAGAILTATAGVALLAAIVVSIGMQLVRNRAVGVARMRAYAPIILSVVLVQGLWMHRTPTPLEWNLPGYPRPYLEQLKVKNGNDPQSGLASPSDVAKRVAGNLYQHSYLLSESLLHTWINPGWPSALIAGSCVLIFLGWGYSLWRSTGQGVLEWYFAAHEGIYLLWPWNMEPRFFLPVAPLACLYLWRGGEGFLFLARHKPRLLGTILLPVTSFFAFATWLWLHGSLATVAGVRPGAQGLGSLEIWIGLSLASAWMAGGPASWKYLGSAASQWSNQKIGSTRFSAAALMKVSAGVVVVALMIVGLRVEVQIGQNNRDQNFLATLVTPDARAGEWIGSHTAADAVVMARHVPVVYHYAGRNMVWFPPSSNAELLMEGIRRMHVDYVVVSQRKQDYYFPPDLDSFSNLQQAYPNAFILAGQGQGFWIYRVVPAT